MSDLARIEPPEDCLYVDADGIDITLAANRDGSLNFGLLVTAPAPLGAIRIQLYRDQVATLRDKLVGLAMLNPEEVADLMAHIRNTNPQEEK
jgi:hypothetical protein